MKNLPNLITASRILLSIIMFFIKPFSTAFWIVYSACGLSDAADGYIARRTNSTSSVGAVLDSIADIAFISAALFILLPALAVPIDIIMWIIIIAIVRIIALVAGYYKYRTFAALHTYFNKFTGILLFCFPYLYSLTGMKYIAPLICATASISAVEELLIQVTSRELNRNIKSIFAK